MNPEAQRLQDSTANGVHWKKWGPYLSERQWGTVREDYSEMADAWDYFNHDQARSRAYRWGEDGLGGICDDQQRLCFALALWNGVDPILKERLFGLTNSEGNHGEDCKEYYYYLDSTPTHSYLKYLYKYPQVTFPYVELVSHNYRRSRFEQEYELMDTGVFDDDRYWDVFLEYAKASPEDIVIQIQVCNRGDVEATLHLLPTLWFRNTWSWGGNQLKPHLHKGDPGVGSIIQANHPLLGSYSLYSDTLDGQEVPLLFTENETNQERIFALPNPIPYVKDSIHQYLIDGQTEAINPQQQGTKASVHYTVTVAAHSQRTIRLRLSAESLTDPFGASFASVLEQRQQEANQFYQEIIPGHISEDEQRVMRQALAGMLWTKQFYFYSVKNWLSGDPYYPPMHVPKRQVQRNLSWFHIEAADIISMPDKWEYPWFAAWDLAFHTAVLVMVDPEFAKEQLLLLTRPEYLHPNGQLPAYEWNFSDVNPPVHASMTWRVYFVEKEKTGQGDRIFLEKMFHKLLLNFTWWVNRKDTMGNNVFEGGFLGLDNIGVFDRSSPLPTGGSLEQADGTAWMAMYSLDMLTIALELAVENPVYEDLACKFYEHFIRIASAMDQIGLRADELWDEEDGFFYDLLRLPGGEALRLKVRSLVGLLPLLATLIVEPETLEKLPTFHASIKRFHHRHPEFLVNIHNPEATGIKQRRLFAVLPENKLRRILERLLDEDRFLSDYGIRALSRYHLEHPYTFGVGNDTYRVTYEPAESSTGLFGGNSNWRGPIWFPINSLIIQALVKFYSYYGDTFLIECPTGSGNKMNLWQVAMELCQRHIAIFLRDEQGRRPVFGSSEKLQTDPHWQDLLLFYEYFHGDNGAGIGASHQTGWTGIVARLIQFQALNTAEQILQQGLKPGVDTLDPAAISPE
ncbi:MAG: glucosidase [Cyanobacteriota bacterium]|nr:glucosidase [Cyanobacteriota bacterium]